ncbi:MAG: YgiT-type zinc finger protein [Firmicutes bacterium]|nr:YgiT-type zinc finger protein [Bacillota bacterium]
MKCYVCGAEMVKRLRDVELTWKGKDRYVFPDIEAWVCLKCGEEVYEPEDARYMLNEAKRKSEGRTDAETSRCHREKK